MGLRLRYINCSFPRFLFQRLYFAILFFVYTIVCTLVSLLLFSGNDISRYKFICKKKEVRKHYAYKLVFWFAQSSQNSCL